MQQEPSGKKAHGGKSAWPTDSSPRTLDTKDVFRQFIADEVRHGRLTPTRRRRVIGYGEALGISAVETRQLIAACRRQITEGHDPTDRYQTLQLTEPEPGSESESEPEPEPERVPIALKISIVVALAILADLLLIIWLI